MRVRRGMKFGIAATVVAVVVLFWLIPTEPVAGNPIPIESTFAFQLMGLEEEVSDVPEERRALLRSVLEDSFASLPDQETPPATRDEFLAFAEAVSVSLARHNFIQPGDSDWPDTLAAALSPIPAGEPRLRAYLARKDNAKRAAHWNREKPFYYVDCDMAALLIISVAQMVGFDLSLVEVPRHNFVRWRGEGGASANWDWTNWASYSDERYARSFRVHPAQVAAGTYLGSQTPAESRGYYLSLIARRAKDPADRTRLKEEAAAAAPRNATAAGNLAWMYATSPTADRRQRQAAIHHALAALSAMPDDSGRLETLACSYAAAGETALGFAVQEQALRKAAEPGAESYRSNLRRIGAGRRCA